MPQYIAKSLGAFSTGVGVMSSANPTVTTLSSPTFDTQRRVTFSTSVSTDFSGVSFTVTGTQDGGNTITDTVVGSSVSTTAWTTVQDFRRITSVLASTSILNIQVNITTNAVGGTPWIPVNTAITPTSIGFGVTYATTRTPMAAVLEYAYDNPPGSGLQNMISSWGDPYPITSTSISTAANTNSAGVCLLPIACWRLSLTSTSTGASTITSSLKVYVTAIQAGLGSGG